MATIAGQPGDLARPSRAEALYRWVATVDHKKIGILYLVTTLAFFLLGGVEALVMRVQLAVPRATVLSPSEYNVLFTMHGTTMIFLVVMPMLLGFANYFVPLMIGARDMSFPRLNALTFWLLLFGGLLLNFSFLSAAAPDQGWFAYAPLTEPPFTLRPTIDYWILGLLVTSIGTIGTAINLIVTIIKERAPEMTLGRMPMFVWMNLVNSFLIIWAIPSLTAAQVLLLFDRRLGTMFFQVNAGGDAVLWQHLFWYFGHPEVYIMVLPAFGMISEIIPVFSRKPLFGFKVVAASGVAIALLSFGVWAHHMFTVGLGFFSDAAFGASSMLIAVPTGIKIFNWLATMWGGRLRLTTAMLFAIAFIGEFTIGGITGVQFATVPVDWQVTDSYYVVAHFHYVLFGGTAFAMLAAGYYWFPKISGRLLSERLGRLNFWLMFIGFNLTFFPMHILGLMGMPRRVYTYPDLPWWGAINFSETIGAFIMGAAVLVLLWNVAQSLRAGQPAGDNPWDAWTLEWATSSPPPEQNFLTLPPITSPRPLWDLTHGRTGATPPTAPLPTRPRAGGRDLRQLPAPVLGVLVFISSEAVFFGALIVTYLLYRHRSPAGPGPEVLDVGRTALFSVALWASSATIILAERRLRRDDQRGFRLWLLATILLGLVFIYGQISEYRHLYADEITLHTNLFSASFFTLTGFHGAHVIIGLIALAILAWLAFAGDLRQGRHRVAAEAISVYWHFVDVVWVVIFALVYLWTLL